jgi:hypothetical protein
VGQAHTPDWLATAWVLRQFGTRRALAHQRFAQFVRDGQTQPSIWHRLRSQMYLGDEPFVARMQSQIREETPLDELPKVQRVCAACRWRTLHGSMAIHSQPWQRPIDQVRRR